MKSTLGKNNSLLQMEVKGPLGPLEGIVPFQSTKQSQASPAPTAGHRVLTKQALASCAGKASCPLQGLNQSTGIA